MPVPEPRILFEDPHLVVLSKATGMLSQGDDSGEENLVDYLRKYFGRHYVGLVHRLDRNTSGLMVVAKRSKAAHRLTESLKSGKLKRSYLAVVEGHPPSEAVLEDYLLKNEEENEMRVVKPDQLGAKLARLSFRCLARGTYKGDEISLLHVELETGRAHQIRIQASHHGYPLVGDSKYRSQIKFHRPALHSFTLEFPHPMSHEFLSFKDPLPGDLEELVPRGTEWP